MPSNERAVVGILRGTFPEGRLTEGQERARPNGPPRSCGWSFPGVWMPTRVNENVLGGHAGKSAMPLRFMALVLVVFIGWTAELGATLVVAYRSSDGIVVAADSLRTRVNLRTGQREQVTACKVREFGDIVFAAAGVSHAAGLFSLDAITVDLRQEDVPLWDRVRMFDHRTEVAFNEAHNGRPETGPAFFTYILGFMLEGRPVAYTREFRSSGGVVARPGANR